MAIPWRAAQTVAVGPTRRSNKEIREGSSGKETRNIRRSGKRRRDGPKSARLRQSGNRLKDSSADRREKSSSKIQPWRLGRPGAGRRKYDPESVTKSRGQQRISWKEGDVRYFHYLMIDRRDNRLVAAIDNIREPIAIVLDQGGIALGKAIPPERRSEPPGQSARWSCSIRLKSALGATRRQSHRLQLRNSPSRYQSVNHCKDCPPPGGAV